MFPAFLIAATSVMSYFFPVLGIIIGLAGVAAYLTGTVRKSISETQTKDIIALDHRIETLEAENEALRDQDNAKSQALEVLMAQIQGSVELAALKAEVERVRVAYENHMARFTHIDNELKFIRTGINKNNRALGSGKVK